MIMGRRLSVKVCGMREPSNIAEVAMLKPEYMGFIFYPQSPRYCGFVEKGRRVCLPDGIVPVAVTVNMPESGLLKVSETCGITTFQLHGDESPEYCRRLKERGFTIWKAFPIDSADTLSGVVAYEECVDMVLLDTSTVGYGGSGRKFDWRLLEKYRPNHGFMLSGGIGEEDAEMVKELNHPQLTGVDLNSRFESKPGVKDAVRLSRFVDAIRNNNEPKK